MALALGKSIVKEPIVIHQGVRNQFHFQLTDTAGTPVSLAGYTGEGWIRYERSDPGDPVATFEVDIEPDDLDNEMTLEDPAGVVRARLEAAGASALTRSGAYEIRLIPPSGVPEILAKGGVILDKEV
jgi:hypothetical protein